MASKSDIDALRLAPRAKVAAVLLNEMFPEVVFTSGLRDINKQAGAMAKNVLRNPLWIGQTYLKGAELQATLDRIKPQTQAAAHLAILEYLQSKPESWLAEFSRHFVGYAFDVQPVVDITGIPTAQGHKIIECLRFKLGAEKVLLKEGGLVVWHVQFTPTEEV